MMSEIWEERFHKAQYVPTSTVFSAVFNAITPGRYDFLNTPACQNVQVMDLVPGTIYWIKNISVGGNIPEADYLGSIVDFPALTVRRQSTPAAIYRFPVPINRFINNGECSAWIVNDVRDDVLTLSLSGSCLQLPTMVGLVTLRVNIALNIYGINDQKFAAEFRGRVCG